jgi:hypothetical protein
MCKTDPNINTKIIIYMYMYVYMCTHIYIYIYKTFLKVGLLKETKGQRKEKNDNNIEIHYICVGTKHNKMHWKLLNDTR